MSRHEPDDEKGKGRERNICNGIKVKQDILKTCKFTNDWSIENKKKYYKSKDRKVVSGQIINTSKYHALFF